MKNKDENNIDYLWQSFMDGNDENFSIIYHQHANTLLEYGHKLCVDQELINDSLQEIFIDLFLKRKKKNVFIKSLKSYLFISFRNALIKKISNGRKFEELHVDKKDVELKFNIEYSYQTNLINEEISKETLKKLSKAVIKLPSKQKEIIYFKFEEGMDYSEISEIMKISVESARKLMYRSLLSLRKTLDPKLVYALFLNFYKIK